MSIWRSRHPGAYGPTFKHWRTHLLNADFDDEFVPDSEPKLPISKPLGEGPAILRRLKKETGLGAKVMRYAA